MGYKDPGRGGRGGRYDKGQGVGWVGGVMGCVRGVAVGFFLGVLFAMVVMGLAAVRNLRL